MSAGFIFLRPWWLLALLALPALLLLRNRRRHAGDAWERAVDPHLLPHLIEAGRESPGRELAWLRPVGAALAILALAGPSWQQKTTPLWQVEAPLVIALDLSHAMLTADLAPSRLVQARHKLGELLTSRRGGQFGLIVYAGDAFTAAPITRDAATVDAVLDDLTPDLIPVEGQRADRAIARAVALMRSAGFSRGEILLVSDHADAAAQVAAREAHTAGFRVSTLGVGTVAGAPLTGARGFVTDGEGKVRLARLDAGSLAALAAAGGGRASTLRPDESDLEALGLLTPQGMVNPGAEAAAGSGSGTAVAVERSDDGYWLILLILPLSLLAFRRHAVVALPLILLVGTLPFPGPAEAARVSGAADAPAPSSSSTWDSLWQRPDQRARAAFAAGDYAQARELAPDSALRGSAAYRSNDFAAAAREFAGADSADADYNRGNALARAGDYPQALAAYDAALAREPGMADAVANRKAVEELLKRQPPEQQKDQQKQDQQQARQQQDQKPQDQQPDKGQKSPGTPQASASGQDQPGDKPPGQSGGQSSGEPGGNLPKDASPADRQKSQSEANAAAKRAMDRALIDPAKTDRAGKDGMRADGREQQARSGQSATEQRQTEQQQAMEQWLRRVPDDPGGLLRRKFALEYQRRLAEGQDP